MAKSVIFNHVDWVKYKALSKVTRYQSKQVHLDRGCSIGRICTCMIPVYCYILYSLRTDSLTQHQWSCTHLRLESRNHGYRKELNFEAKRLVTFVCEKTLMTAICNCCFMKMWFSFAIIFSGITLLYIRYSHTHAVKWVVGFLLVSLFTFTGVLAIDLHAILATFRDEKGICACWRYWNIK